MTSHLAASFVLICTLWASSGFSEEQDQPNVVVVITDDQGYGDLSCHGNPVFKTPGIDQLYN